MPEVVDDDVVDVVVDASETVLDILSKVPSMYPVVDDCRMFISTNRTTPSMHVHTTVDFTDDRSLAAEPLMLAPPLRTSLGRAIVCVRTVFL